ncbi:DUF2905 domain-containing protein [Pelotalea chapellei]|uniref:DUF2905 family protein n=1 Tax=Pelotalea chapellei TaxID=44671 RepID=A0ABS5U803_9BACT|nr:DUF2905 domain-containing protein [Pelotalea chapellei]MBT1071788.1 DUF2905 family protein [Pelotalea chapellei]
MNGLGRSLVTIGVVLVVVGLIISLGPRIPWIGKLPGDIYIKKENFSFYFPIGTCILISLLLSFVLWLLRR